MSNLNPDMQPFDIALQNLSFAAPAGTREALVDVADTIDFAKRILLQHKVKTFTASDVIAVAQMILDRRNAITNKLQEGVGDEIF